MIEEMMRTSEMQDGVFHLKDYAEAVERCRDAKMPVWGAITDQELIERNLRYPSTQEFPHWVETPRGLSEVQARQAVKVAVEAKTGERVNTQNIMYDP